MSPEVNVRAIWKPLGCQAQLLPMAFLRRSPVSGSRLPPLQAHVLLGDRTLSHTFNRECLYIFLALLLCLAATAWYLVDFSASWPPSYNTPLRR